MLHITTREASEILLALVYARDFHHGTAGHNSYMVLAKLATAVGFRIDEDVKELQLLPPSDVLIVEEPKRAPYQP